MTFKVVSDVHGFYDELVKSLDEAKFDENKMTLIDCGDFFDRGTQDVEVYKYYKRLTDENKAIVLRGNHTTMLIDFLEGKDSKFNYAWNGLDKTIDSFLGDTMAWSTFLYYLEQSKEQAIQIYGEEVKTILNNPYVVPSEIIFQYFQDYAREKINKEYPELLSWLKERPYYYETQNYIFTHASIDGQCKDWHNPEIKASYDESWDYLTWDDGRFYNHEIKNTNKAIVVGHFYTDAIRKKNGIEPTGSNEILKSKDGKKIFIDTCTPLTHKVNVLTIEDEEIGG